MGRLAVAALIAALALYVAVAARTPALALAFLLLCWALIGPWLIGRRLSAQRARVRRR